MKTIDNININEDHYEKVRRVRSGDGSGYCFVLNKKLGFNGEIEHPLQGKRVKFTKEDTDVYTVDKVCVHWAYGYYIVVSIVDKHGSHGQLFIENINCYDETLLGLIKSQSSYKIFN